VPPAPDAKSEQELVAQWVKSLDHQRARELLHRILAGDTTAEKARLLAQIRDSQTSVGWPTSDKQRTFEQLLQKTADLRATEDAKQVRTAQAKARRESFPRVHVAARRGPPATTCR
jgi:hypothetical protein